MKGRGDMKTSVIGYPRVGVLRELKFATENILKMLLPRKNFKLLLLI